MKDNNTDARKFLIEYFPEKMTTGQVIRAKRKNFGITLEEVRMVTDIPITHLSAIENDKKQIGLKIAIKIGFAIGLHPLSILFPNGFETDEQFAKIKKKGEKLLHSKRF